MSAAKKKDDQPTVIKKYANRRLYDTGRSSYVTLDDLCTMVKEGRDFVVYDAKSGEDLTRSVLTQIIVDQESKGENLLPVSFLKQLIGFYGDSLQSLVPNYLEQTISSFSMNQEQFRDQMSKQLEGMMTNPVASFEELNKQNMAMFEKAMNAWTSSFPMAGAAANGGPAKAATSEKKDKIDELKKNIEKMEAELDRLSGE